MDPPPGKGREAADKRQVTATLAKQRSVKPQTASLGSATGNPRNKVALQPGHSLMDWIRLGNSGVDLTGVGGVPRDVSPRELSVHNKPSDAWISIRGKVFNVTRYMDFHPGGQHELMRGVGTDATELFNQIHAWVNYSSILQKCVVGHLQHSEENHPGHDLKAALFCNKPCKPCSPTSTKAMKRTPLSVPMDWFQQVGSVTLVYYTKVTSPQAEVHLSGTRDLSVWLRLGDRALLSHLSLDNDVQWPCTVRASPDTGKVEVTLTKVKAQPWKSFGSALAGNGTFYDSSELLVKYSPMRLVKAESVTHNTKLLLLRYQDNILNTIPVGHHIAVRSIIDGAEVVRSYTPVLPSLIPAFTPPDWSPNTLCLLVKGYADGRLSSWLCSLPDGATVDVAPPRGSFCTQQMRDCSHLVLLAAGTGITPMISLIRWALDKMRQKVTLIFFNRKESDIIWREQLDKMADENERFSAIHILSEAEAGWGGRRGHIDEALLQEFLPDTSSESPYYACVCGPTLFTEKTKTLLQKLGLQDNHYHCFLS